MSNIIRLLLVPLVAITLFVQADSKYTNIVYAERPEAQLFADEMVNKYGGSRNTWLLPLRQAYFQPQVITLVMPVETTGKKNWQAYRQRFVNATRIRSGVAFWSQYELALQRAEKEYGIPAEIIVSIIGIETLYGKKMGEFNVLDTLATLAFDYPETPNREIRAALFKQELEYFLLWTQSINVAPNEIRGSYTGAIGIPQFLPSSIHKYAVNFAGDKQIDLIRNPIDAIGSIANFLKQHGWEEGRSIVWKITDNMVSQEIAQKYADGLPKPRLYLQQLLNDGLTVDEPVNIATESKTALLVADFPTPDQPTEYLLGLQNFYVLTRYNQSFFYARAVYDLARALYLAKNVEDQ